jgi:hypothetical protein
MEDDGVTARWEAYELSKMGIVYLRHNASAIRELAERTSRLSRFAN